MYTLFVSAEVQDRNQGTFAIATGRFLEYTSSPIHAQLEPLSVEAIRCLKAWPCLVMTEGTAEQTVSLAQIRDVERTASGFKLTVTPRSDGPVLTNAILWASRHDLDIEQFEFGRHHFAVKDRDLLGVLRAHGHLTANPAAQAFADLPLPAPPRSALIAAIDAMAGWSHSDIDRFLMEAGIVNLHAGRELGSRKNRAQAIIKYAIDHPSAKTEENSLFSAFIVNSTVDIGGNSQPAATKADHPSADVTSGTAGHHCQHVDTKSDVKQFKKLKLFYSYSHQDEELRKELEKHLSHLKREGVIDEWHDRKISAGSEWKDQIDEHLSASDLVLLLVSADFIASDYCYDIETRKALELHSAGKCRVIPIILRPVDWMQTPFAKLQALPKDARPITKWEDRDEALMSIAVAIRTIANEINKSGENR